MAEDSDYTFLTRREIAASGIGSDPKVVAAFEGLQNAAFSANPASAAAAQEAAESAAAAATGAQDAADTAAFDAAAALALADDAYDLAGTKVTKSLGPAWAAPSGIQARSTLAAYVAPTISGPPTQAEVQALADAVQAMSRALVAVIADLRANEALTP